MTRHVYCIIRKCGECCDFCPCADNRAVSVLAVRDPEGVTGVRTKSAVLYTLEQ
ncbi:MAG: hypothetical protein K2O31_03475 [Clostridia bacterium]|nr:hypothetical protein [Clostridia bacterium]